jgi:hypothetical protein
LVGAPLSVRVAVLAKGNPASLSKKRGQRQRQRQRLLDGDPFGPPGLSQVRGTASRLLVASQRV